MAPASWSRSFQAKSKIGGVENPHAKPPSTQRKVSRRKGQGTAESWTQKNKGMCKCGVDRDQEASSTCQMMRAGVPISGMGAGILFSLAGLAESLGMETI